MTLIDRSLSITYIIFISIVEGRLLATISMFLTNCGNSRLGRWAYYVQIPLSVNNFIHLIPECATII